MSEREIVICNPVRTAIGTFGGSLTDPPDQFIRHPGWTGLVASLIDEWRR